MSEITALSCLISDTLKEAATSYYVETKTLDGCHPMGPERGPEPQLPQSQLSFHIQSCVQVTAEKQLNLSEIRALVCTLLSRCYRRSSPECRNGGETHKINATFTTFPTPCFCCTCKIKKVSVCISFALTFGPPCTVVICKRFDPESNYH